MNWLTIIWLRISTGVTQSLKKLRQFTCILGSKMISRGLIWTSCLLRRETWKMRYRIWSNKFKKYSIRQRVSSTTWTQSKGMSTKSSRKRMGLSSNKLALTGVNWRRLTLGWHRQRLG